MNRTFWKFRNISTFIVAVVLAGACCLHGDELNERMRQTREREAGMYNEIYNNSGAIKVNPIRNPYAGSGDADYWARIRAGADRMQQEERARRAEAERADDERRREAFAKRQQYEIEKYSRQAWVAEQEEQAKAGDVNAFANLGVVYLTGRYAHFGIPRDLARAEKYFALYIAGQEKARIVPMNALVLLGGVQYM